MKSEDIIRDGQEAFKAFVDQLDGENDIYKQIVLEEVFRFIFEEIYGVKIREEK